MSCELVADPNGTLTVYDVIGEPPLLTGGFQLTGVSEVDGSNAPTVRFCGAPGELVNTTLLTVAGAELPAGSLAVTLTVYGTPSVSDEIVH
jgi:hypothetical protein